MRWKIGIASLFLLIAVASIGLAQDGPQSIAVVISVNGNVELLRGEDSWRALTFGAVLNDGDKIRTGAESYLAIIFTDDRSQIRIRPNTELTINAERRPDYSLDARLTMEIGELFADVREQKGRLQVATPTTVASVKGTQFWILVNQEGTTQVLTLEGLLELLNTVSGQVIDVGEGEIGTSDGLGDIILEVLGDDYNIPEWVGEDGAVDQIEIQFQDEDGTTRTLIIQYHEEE